MSNVEGEDGNSGRKGTGRPCKVFGAIVKISSGYDISNTKFEYLYT